jgi:hypothetical protein
VTLAKGYPEVAPKMLGQQGRGPVRLCQSPNNWRAPDISGHELPLFVGQFGRLVVARANPQRTATKGARALGPSLDGTQRSLRLVLDLAYIGTLQKEHDCFNLPPEGRV